MEWMVIGQVRLDKQNKEAYSLALKKILERCSSIREDFEVGQTLLGIITDWSDAEINGFEAVVGRAKAMELLKECKVHWQHSCQHVADRVATSSNRKREKDIFLVIASQVQKLESAIDIVSCFEELRGVQPIKELLKKNP